MKPQNKKATASQEEPRAESEATIERADGKDAAEIFDHVKDTDQDNDGQDLAEDLDSPSGENEDEPADRENHGTAAKMLHHNRAEEVADIERDLPAPDVSYYAPIVRIDREKREVIGTATAEVEDAHGTVIGYDASKDAFSRWAGNIREMHDAKKAVGRALEITPDDEGRRIVVRAKISKGAEDTWQKVLDGTLTGFCIGGRNGRWTQRMIDGKKVPFLERYDQSELSLVDNPSCPSANDVAIVRADGIVSEVLATEQEVVSKAAKPADEVQRSGARVSKETQSALHVARDHSKDSMSATCSTCGCDECNDHLDKLGMIGKNAAGDSDRAVTPESIRALVADVVREQVSEILREQLSPVTARVNAMMAAEAQRSDVSPDFTRRVDDVSAKLAEIQEIVERIADQPVGDGPVLHGAGIDKTLATQNGNYRRGTDADAIRRATELGFQPPSALNEQMAAAAKLIAEQQRH